MDVYEVAALVGGENVMVDRKGDFSIGGKIAPVVAFPDTADEVSRLVQYVAARDGKLVVYGGGTRVHTGFPPEALDLILCTRRMNQVVDYQPDDMTITVQPGMLLADLERQLAARDQFLPLNPTLPRRSTVGGIMATAASGPWRAGYGTPRDWVIGCRVIGADGQEVRGGGAVVKNVAGYDLPKLYTGSYGTLGVITEITFKVLPRPAARAFCRVHMGGPQAAEAVLARALASDLQPSVVELACGGNPKAEDPEALEWWLFFQFLGVEAANAWQIDHLRTLAEQTPGVWLEELSDAEGAEVLLALRDAPTQYPFAARVTVTSSRVAEFAERAAELSRQHGHNPAVTAHAATGQVLVLARESATQEFAEALRAAARDAGGNCLFERLPAPLWDAVDPWGPAGPEVKLMRGIKAALDPHGIFSPGRFVDRI